MEFLYFLLLIYKLIIIILYFLFQPINSKELDAHITECQKCVETQNILKSSIDKSMADVPIKKIALLALLASIIISIFIFLPSIKFSSPSKENKNDTNENVKKEEKEKIIDDNYLFVKLLKATLAYCGKNKINLNKYFSLYY